MRTPGESRWFTESVLRAPSPPSTMASLRRFGDVRFCTRLPVFSVLAEKHYIVFNVSKARAKEYLAIAPKHFRQTTLLKPVTISLKPNADANQ